MSNEPKRDVIQGNNVCDECGGDAYNTIGGEHIWKCSEIVAKDDLRELVAELRAKRSEADEDNGFSTGLAIGYDAAADKVEELL